MGRRWIFALLAVAAGALALDGQNLIAKLEAVLQLKGNIVPASSAVLSEHEREEIDGMAPQDQLMRLLERTVNHYQGAAEEIEKRADGWIGKIHSTQELTKLSEVAYFSSDLRVRAAALEVWRVEAGFAKSPETVDALIAEANIKPERTYFYLSHLGIQGNRGIEREKVFQTLVRYLHDPDPNFRAAAINGMGLLGTGNTIPELLEVLRADSSYDLRERAACNLADSGLLSREQRKGAVPELVRFAQDPNLDARTKKWVYQALREITEQHLGDDPGAWSAWLGAHANHL